MRNLGDYIPWIFAGLEVGVMLAIAWMAYFAGDDIYGHKDDAS